MGSDMKEIEQRILELDRIIQNSIEELSKAKNRHLELLQYDLSLQDTTLLLASSRIDIDFLKKQIKVAQQARLFQLELIS